MIMRTRNLLGLPLLAALLIFAAPTTGQAQDLFRLYPELLLSGFYSDNVPLRTSNEIGDFAGTGAAGFYLDYTSEARYASLHYDTFAQLFTHQTRFDRAGEGQFVSATDDENISPTTKLRLDELFYRDSPTFVGIITSDQAPEFNSIAAQLLLANDQATINRVNAELSHYWSRRWSSELTVNQTTFWNNGSSVSSNNSTSYGQSISTVTDYHFSDRFYLGAGYRFYDFLFSRPGQPGEQAHWPFLRVGWRPLRNLSFTGSIGVIVSYTQGSSRQSVNPGGMGLLEYDYQRARLRVYGGQEPELTSSFSGAGILRSVRGHLLYDFTQRLTGSAGGGYYELSGAGVNAQLISWGFGLSERVNKWLRAYANFVQIRRTETTSSQFLPAGNQNGQEAVGDYFVVGFSASVEAFRWSWQ